MSSVNYSLNHKGVRHIDAKDAWVVSKNGKYKLNPNYHFVGKVEISMSNIVITANEKVKEKEP